MTEPGSFAAAADRIDVRLVSLPTHSVLGAAHERRPAQHRELVYVSLHGDSTGWGECSALNAATYSREWATGAYEMLSSGRPVDAAAAPMAAAAIEMALLDLDLRHNRESLATRLGTTGLSVPAGAAVGLAEVPALLSEVEGLVEAGYRRVKLKVTSDHLAEPVSEVMARFPLLEVQIDANGSLGPADHEALVALGILGVTAIEQPFPVGDLTGAARLVAAGAAAVVADEAVSSIADLNLIAERNAATTVSIKPPRVGGLGPALELLAAARQATMGAAVGGMLESGLGRHMLAAMAPLPGFDITGDLSPAGRWLAVDPFSDIAMIDGRVPAPGAIGIAADPDLDRLAAHTVAHTALSWPLG